ncbi:type 2 lanthipeptide synthetase LanM family protein [Ktedonospora formicarum]|uniref:Lantibiotic biosynthesis protein dehydration domain-containing protein n=1 Tax=Ktedonospora formicarum TaxID=2778364 RepID=A0A8J3I5I4_9CHLR|nr:type 2 lanthipeptide synthetase LanM family protein [Ktedonospora formicarum]GHO49949.1 hypothetical protein KSX_81120 [Ktedonospora formicarum]
MTRETTSSKVQHTRYEWNTASWYHALTLNERLPARASLASVPISEKARWKLARWQEQVPFQAGTFFADRLALDGLSEEDLLALLAETPESLQTRLSSSPPWLEALRKAFDEREPFCEAALPLEDVKGSMGDTLFVGVLHALLQPGLKRLEQGVGELVRRYRVVPFDPTTIVPLLFAHLPKLLFPQVSRTLVLELHVARIEGRLVGETAQERFQHFITQLRQEDGIWPILQEYSVLARQLSITIERWLTCELEFLERLCADWSLIQCTFAPGHNPGVLTGIEAGVGDTHRGGRSVRVLSFHSGLRLVYKPKSLAVDQHFQELLNWLNEQGYELGFRTHKVLDRGTYGWVEYIEAQTCLSSDQVERFYQRQGAYLALLYALEATDFHAENLIAAGEHPVLIDLEALFHPRVEDDDSSHPDYAGLQAIGYSVYRIGLLPYRLWSANGRAGVDVSGLGGQAGQFSPTPLPAWKDLETDQMRIVHEHLPLNTAHNLPQLHHRDVIVQDYCESVLFGFRSMYCLLQRQREALLHEQLPRFLHDEIRCVLRPTRIYSLLARESFHPDVLRDALDRERLLDRLWIGVEQAPDLLRVIEAEREDLRQGDIPYFTTSPGSRDLLTSSGKIIPAFFAEPSSETVQRCLCGMDEQDLEKQCWIIKSSFATAALGSTSAIGQHLQLMSSAIPASMERLMAGARAAGDWLCEKALFHNGCASWLGVNAIQEREWRLVPADMSLYSGTAGIVLFLAYLGALTQEPRYTTVARAGLATFQLQVKRQMQAFTQKGIGVFEGLGVPVYLYAHVGKIWNDETFFREAEEIVAALSPYIAQDQTFDIIGGAAGYILALLSLYAVAPSAQLLSMARQCGEHLGTHAQMMPGGKGWSTKTMPQPLTGFAHGAAGIAYSLFALSTATREARFCDLAREAMEYERHLFSEEKQNWPDLRQWNTVDTTDSTDDNASSADIFMTAWCHGAAGIGLARLHSLRHFQDTQMYQEIESAVETTIRSGFGLSHSLCHGDLGNLEVLLMGATLLHKPSYQHHLEHFTAMLLESIERQGWMSGTPLAVETPGFMIGIAGIGYELLRLAQPERVPSVLLLMPPQNS